MKRFGKLGVLMLALIFNAVSGGAIAFACGVAPGVGALAMNGVAALGIEMPKALLAGVFREVWTGEMVKALRASDGQLWLEGIQDMSQYVTNVGDEAAVIHITHLGADPDVLINNTTYPIDVQALTDTDATISLDKYQTKATPVTDDELYACSYDKMGSTIERHKLAITDKKYMKAIHSLCPASHSATTPLIRTTGATVTGESRKALTIADIIALKKAFDKMNVPVQGRRLVLTSDHVNDLLAIDQKFKDQYSNFATGKIANLLSFEIYEYNGSPMIASAGTKKAFGAASAAGDQPASVAFYAPRMTKATGWTKQYYSEAKNDPLTQRNLVNFRHYFIVVPKKNEMIGAIVSENV